MRSIRKKIMPVTVVHPSTQNIRRWLVGLDVRSSLSMAATGGNAFALYNPLNHLETTANTDVTSADLGAVSLRARQLVAFFRPPAIVSAARRMRYNSAPSV